jgi:signal transduction histidine kinase/ActR/RegA family two-component response regulator
MFYYSFLLSKNLTYFIIMGVGIMNSVALIACAFLVSVGRPGTRLTLGVIFLCFVMLGITHHMSSQYLTSFEYYMAYRRSVLSEADRTTEMARREREHLRMVLANVAHDLKTPLQAFDAGIHTIRSLVEENVPSNVFFGATARDVLNAVDASCAFMTMQINRALDVSKIQSHVKLMPKYESVNIESIVRWAVDTMSCIQNRIEIDVTYSQWPSHFRNVITDKVWFQENLLCLLSNAVKYSNDDSAVQLNLRIDEPPSESRRNSLNSSPNREANLADGNTFHLLTVEVIDSGIGVPEDRRHFLFKPFSQTQRCAGGTGLGLYSLALRVHRLGGSYGMRPRENGGSVFYFSILVKEDLTVSPTSSDSSNLPQPLLAQSIDEDHPADRTKTPSQTISWRQRSLEKGAAETEITFLTSGSADPLPLRSEGAQPRLRAAIASRCPLVLVVDDAPTALKMVQKALVQAGAEVNTATNGFTALKMMKSNLYTLVIMDIQMPVMDGFEAVRQLRAWERGPQGGGMHQYIIGASASPPGDDTSKYAIDVGMDEFCAKPFVFHDLVQKVRMLHASDGGGCCQ